jgi:hypothetical protein
MKRAAMITTLFGLLAIAFGLASCYQAQHSRTPNMYPGSDGGNGVWETRIMRFFASVLIGVAALCVANYLRWKASRQQEDLTIRLQARPGSRLGLQSSITVPASLSRFVCSLFL